MTVTVLQPGPDDWQVVRETRLRALLDAPEAFYRTYAESAALDDGEWRSRLANPDRVTFVAEQDGRPVGLIGGGPAGEDEQDDEAASMVSMWVEPECRGKGIAEALTAALVDWCRDQGYQRLLLWVYDDAPRAAAFYRKVGFTATGRAETFQDDARPLTLMMLPVTSPPAGSKLQASTGSTTTG